jgi:hypothetical protein
VNTLACAFDNHAASKPLRAAQSKGADDSPAQQLLDLEGQGALSVCNYQDLVEAWQFTGEGYVDYWAADS